MAPTASTSAYQPVRDDDAHSDVDDDELDDLAIPLPSPRAQRPVADPSTYASQRGSLDDEVKEGEDAEALLASSASPRPKRMHRPRAPSFSRFSFELPNVLSMPLSVDVEPGGHVDRSLGMLGGVALVLGAVIVRSRTLTRRCGNRKRPGQRHLQ
jgi:hypothetical protein